MTKISSSFVVLLTKDQTNAGSNALPNLVINDGGIRDNLQIALIDLNSTVRRRGQAHLYPINNDLELNLDRMSNSSIRLGIRGDDRWALERCMVWGISDQKVILPIGLDLGINKFLSTDFREGDISIPIKRVKTGNRKTEINHLMFIVQTENQSFPGDAKPKPEKFETGTDDKIRLQVRTKDGNFLVDHIIENTPQDDLESGQSNFYLIPTKSSFRYKDLDSNSIQLSILGKDAWLPKKMFLFGIDRMQGEQQKIIPLVHLNKWENPRFSTDPKDDFGKALETQTLDLLSHFESFGRNFFGLDLTVPVGGGVIAPIN